MTKGNWKRKFQWQDDTHLDVVSGNDILIPRINLFVSRKINVGDSKADETCSKC
jgi:hypothetical protein